jgi:cephalosporin-C deacetylase-like acetyl esterase
MSKRANAQSWIVNSLIAASGYEVLHPESRHFLAELGYDPVHFDRVISRVKTGAQLPKAFSEVGLEVERKAKWYQEQGFDRAARDLYLRASLMFGHAHYFFPLGDDRKDVFRAAVNRCTEEIIKLNPTRVERVEVPFEGQTIYGLAHYPAQVQPAPLVILLPGMDMYKEEWTKVAQEYYASRGMIALAVDGPGQGESYSNGVLVSSDGNYERAISAFIDHMLTKPEVDREKIAIWGVSMGSYWGLRCAALDKRLTGVATAMGCYGNMETIFEKAQPGFKANFMRMTGYTDEDAFETDIVATMGVASLVDQIECPVMMTYGEFDELSTLPETIALFGKIKSPKRLMVFEQEFHSLGGVGAELIGSAADWIVNLFAGKIDDAAGIQDYIGRDGRIGRGSAVPPWWANESAI